MLHRSLMLPVIALLLISSVGSGQAKRPMTLVDMLEMPSVGDPQLSPDGKQILFTITKADWKANNRVSHIWRINADGSGLIRMTNGQRGENSPRWSPDGSWIAFLARREAASGTESDEAGSQIHLISNSGGEARPVAKHETSVSSISWAPDGSSVYFLAADPKTTKEKEKDKVKDDVYAFDENYKQVHLWTVTVPGGKESRITQGEFSINSYALSRSGKKIVVSRGRTPLLGDREWNEVFVMNSSGGEVVQLTKNRIAEGSIEISPDDAQVLITAGANQAWEPYYNSNLFIAPAAGGEPRLVVPDFPYGVDGARWSKDGKSIQMACNMGVHEEIVELDLATRNYRQVTRGDHAIAGGGMGLPVPDDTLVFTLSTPYLPGEIHILRPGQSEPVRVTRVFEYVTRDFLLPKEEKVQWKGKDGVTVEGVLTYPLDYQAGSRYPLAVHTHGGPQASDKLSFSSWMQYRPVLAAKGYAVLQPNYRGSTGYGNAFLRDMVGHYFSQAHLDVITGVDYLIERGIADPDKLAKLGWSGGGHMTNKIVTFTDRFKAASSGAGASNWISMYAQSDVRNNRTPWFGGTPWQKDAPIAAYWDNSPLKDVWKVKTPTIILVGERDMRVPMPQSVEMYRALKSNGVPVHLYVAPREPHGWGELRHGLFKMNVELDWFEKYVTQRPYTWENAPAEAEPGKAAKP